MKKRGSRNRTTTVVKLSQTIKIFSRGWQLLNTGLINRKIAKYPPLSEIKVTKYRTLKLR